MIVASFALTAESMSIMCDARCPVVSEAFAVFLSLHQNPFTPQNLLAGPRIDSTK